MAEFIRLWKRGFPMLAFVRRTLQAADLRYIQLLLIGFLIGNGIAAVLFFLWPSPQEIRSKNYSYATYRASNGVKLHAMRTSPDNIVLRPIASNVTKTEEFGINGGFFWNGDLLSVAVNNDRPIKGEPNDYGSGWYNVDYPKGTLVWDEATRRFSVQVVQEAGELKVTDKGRYWAQGGVSMSLQQDGRWAEQAQKEDMPAFDEARLRSGVAYDRGQNVWMLLSDKPCTVEEFRSAVKEVIAPGQLVDGVFLDGDGSSQMRCYQAQLKGDSREVYQMMALKAK
ncbi:hypothetical protein O9H85_26935 [Paenibacillus filicis]|uniref:Phosphodiester glycosidase domain-containing protein n=1 Tax=Paenibacillus gyeongsangnamensis TaxID=3388067 RepID=A0ABT4QGG1_9BACL|nr:hypothetical protein [Paenibacillus filicis]MCZ8515971.1 hypothetical protein [Paenibacillus filicis]